MRTFCSCGGQWQRQNPGCAPGTRKEYKCDRCSKLATVGWRVGPKTYANTEADRRRRQVHTHNAPSSTFESPFTPRLPEPEHE